MKRLVLAGAGHAHLHVLRSLRDAPLPGVDIVLVSPHSRQIYSGMVPGWIAGHYELEQCVIPIAPLLGSSVRFVQDALCEVDIEQGQVRLQGSGTVPYDLLSLDTGAALALDAGLEQHPGLLPIRPLETFVAKWEGILPTLLKRRRADVVVAGGGAAGVELALAIAYRLRRQNGSSTHHVSLACGGGLLPGHAPGVVSRAREALARGGVAIVESRVVAGSAGAETEDGRPLVVDWIVTATGVRPPDWLADSGLALAPDGFVAVGPAQQSVSHPAVFAAGDIATRIDAPHAKSGVYAVRAGPVLARNLRRALMGQPPLPYTPQSRSLYLLATGPKDAIASWGRFSIRGPLIWRWKDWIDRRFIASYRSIG